jgi:hypothetical protein
LVGLGFGHDVFEDKASHAYLRPRRLRSTEVTSNSDALSESCVRSVFWFAIGYVLAIDTYDRCRISVPNAITFVAKGSFNTLGARNS